MRQSKRTWARQRIPGSTVYQAGARKRLSEQGRARTETTHRERTLIPLEVQMRQVLGWTGVVVRCRLMGLNLAWMILIIDAIVFTSLGAGRQDSEGGKGKKIMTGASGWCWRGAAVYIWVGRCSGCVWCRAVGVGTLRSVHAGGTRSRGRARRARVE
ncbi:hypothetical protein LZ32DRAFT_179032 [Colletotrichum eremochloae]|nr:hypothetical protein LY78DRAFT_221942 [Colletotrichum sublineola]KAK2014859.1 hypothetical protein LZ32DRAFT_179032 [Colletotrichum eremochloae]